jgi:hypothetical protein
MTTRNNNVRSVAAAKSFCKVCKDAGKSETEYTNHWVKSRDRLTGETITTCPTLLSQECRYCHKVGHTAKYCQAIADKNKYDEKKSKPIQKQQEKSNTASTKQVTFAVLAYDSDEEEQTKPQPVVSAPNLVNKPALTSWAAIAAKPVQVVVQEPVSVFTQLSRSSSVIEPPRMTPIIMREKTPSIASGLEPAPGWVQPILIPKPVLTRSEVLGRPAPIRRKPGKSWADDDSDEEVEMEIMPTLNAKFKDLNNMNDIKLIPDYDPTW